MRKPPFRIDTWRCLAGRSPTMERRGAVKCLRPPALTTAGEPQADDEYQEAQARTTSQSHVPCRVPCPQDAIDHRSARLKRIRPRSGCKAVRAGWLWISSMAEDTIALERAIIMRRVSVVIAMAGLLIGSAQALPRRPQRWPRRGDGWPRNSKDRSRTAADLGPAALLFSFGARRPRFVAVPQSLN